MIRNAAKAILLRGDEILLIKNNSHGEDWYLLPGGGQEKFETIEAALKRECLEESGYEVRPLELLFVRDYISRNHEFAASEGDVHQIEYMFYCELVSEKQGEASHPDGAQVGLEWVKLDDLRTKALFPKALAGYIADWRAGRSFPRYWGDVN